METKVQKEFLGEVFTYKTTVDKNGKALWTKEIDSRFSQWLYDLKNEKRELFKVQYSISQNYFEILEKLKIRLGVYDESLLVRAITIIFIDFIDTRKGRLIFKKLNSYKESEDFKVLVEGDTLKRNLYFSPIGMREVEAYSSLTGLKKCNVVKNALYSVLLLSINEDKEIQECWETEILSKISTIVKAA